MLHRIFGPQATHYKELASIADQLGAASSLLSPGSRSSADASVRLRALTQQTAGLRRKLEARLARVGAPPVDPRLTSEAAAELCAVVRLVSRVVRCREWLRLDPVPAELAELQAVGLRRVAVLAEAAGTLGNSGRWLRTPVVVQPMEVGAEELYDRGVGRLFEGSLDPVEVLRRKAMYDVLLDLVLGSERALEALQSASLE